MGVDILDKEPRPDAWFRAILHNLAGSDVVEAYGYLDDLNGITVIPTSRMRLPNEEEHAWALQTLRTDPELARRLDAGEVEATWPMPPLAGGQTADGSVDRAITVGLRELTESGARHRVVAVRARDGEVLEGVAELPGSDRDCGSPPGREGPAVPGEDQARVRVWRGEELLWDLVVVRPSASSGANGSGVELRAVDHLGKRVLNRGHVPILNLEYEGDGGAMRLWQSSEAGFEAPGEDPVPGFRLCSVPPRTIAGADAEAGDFRGVALWLDGDDLVVLSQVEAGWHRYVSEWRLSADGRIRPRLRFGAVQNPATGRSHVHHAYWRLDFDIPDADNNAVQEFNDPPVMGFGRLQTVRYETRRPRSAVNHRSWQVRDDRFGRAYVVVPGADDGDASAFGVGDVWVLRYSEYEIDDGEGITTDAVRSRAQIDRFLNGDPVHREDVVLWYAAHSGDGVTIGPDLNPRFWRPDPEPQSEPVEPLDLSRDR